MPRVDHTTTEPQAEHPHDSLRKEQRKQHPGYKPQGQGQAGHKQQEVEFGADGQPVRGGEEGGSEAFLPKRPDVIDVSSEMHADWIECESRPIDLYI